MSIAEDRRLETGDRRQKIKNRSICVFVAKKVRSTKLEVRSKKENRVKKIEKRFFLAKVRGTKIKSFVYSWLKKKKQESRNKT